MKWLRVGDEEGKVVSTIPFVRAPYRRKLSPLGRYIIATKGRGQLIVHDASTMKPVATLYFVTNRFAFSSDESFFAVVTDDYNLTVYMWPSMRVRATFQREGWGFHDVCYSSYLGQFVVVLKAEIRAYDLDTMTFRCLVNSEMMSLGCIVHYKFQLVDCWCAFTTETDELLFVHLETGELVSAQLERVDAPDRTFEGDGGVYTVEELRDNEEEADDLVSKHVSVEAEEEEEEGEEAQETHTRDPPSIRLPWVFSTLSTLLFAEGILLTRLVERNNHDSYASSRLDVWEASTGALLQRRFFNRGIDTMDVCPDGKTLLLTMVLNPVRTKGRFVLQLRSVPSLDCIFEVPFFYGAFPHLALSARGDLLVGGEYPVVIFKVESQDVVWRRRRLLWISRLKDPLSFWGCLPMPMFRVIIQYV
eukprot:GILJ01002173.1.p1 GENE.GILJ01002173.1~~GILJ01002173.1.p1  ORF type:complete len:418 (-),score=48.75 GILJ01002173.1:1187-2440(-)